MAAEQVLPGSDLVLWSMWAITEFTQENGATLVVPGSRETFDTHARTHTRGGVVCVLAFVCVCVCARARTSHAAARVFWGGKEGKREGGSAARN